ncbi:MAG: hypothetical protein IH831_03650 [Planctomycetes bacterium]|nr:hypothetical protein [Planctomycetota bacterium]
MVTKPRKTATKKTRTKATSGGAGRKTSARKAPKRASAVGKSLVIVESPAKAKTLERYLGPDYTVVASYGHVRDLPAKDGSVRPDEDFAMTYEAEPKASKHLAAIARALKGARNLYLATDPDREGEAIAWHVAEQLGNGSEIRRVLFHEVTKEAVLEAIAHPVAIDDRKVDAQQARRILDRLVGYKVSPLLWKSVKTGLSAGRVQTVALRLLVEREEEIEKFTAEEYWSIEAELEAKEKQFVAKLNKIEGKKPHLRSQDEATAIVNATRDEPFVVSKVTRRERRRRPAARQCSHRSTSWTRSAA